MKVFRVTLHDGSTEDVKALYFKLDFGALIFTSSAMNILAYARGYRQRVELIN